MKLKTEKQQDASDRHAERAARSPAEQLRLLDQRFGKGVGATKERARLIARVAAMPFERSVGA